MHVNDRTYILEKCFRTAHSILVPLLTQKLSVVLIHFLALSTSFWTAGVPAAQLSAVLAYKRTINGEEKRQKLNITDSTNFGIILRIHAKETDAHFVISLKRSKKDRKGAARRKAPGIDDEEDARSSRSESPLHRDPPSPLKEDHEALLQAKPKLKEPTSPVSTLPQFPGLSPPSPVSPEQDASKSPQRSSAAAGSESLPQQTSPGRKTEVARSPEPPLSTSEPDRSSLVSRPQSVNSDSATAPPKNGPSKQVVILQRPQVPVPSGRFSEALTRSPGLPSPHQDKPPHSLLNGPSFVEAEHKGIGRHSGRAEDPQVSNAVEFSAQPALSQQFRAPSNSGPHPRPFKQPEGAYSHHPVDAHSHPVKFRGQPLDLTALAASSSREQGRFVTNAAKQVLVDTTNVRRPAFNPPSFPRPQVVSASMIASAVSAAAEALTPRRAADAIPSQQLARHVSGRGSSHVARISPAGYRQQRELTPLEMAGLSGVLRDMAAATSSRDGFAGYEKACKFCVFCREHQRGPPPFHWW
jgi:hypothetical protein